MKKIFLVFLCTLFLPITSGCKRIDNKTKYNMQLNLKENILHKGVQNLFTSKNIYGCTFLFFEKIYARKWLYQAVCGHNIFFAKISWYGRQDLNLHALALEPNESVTLLEKL